jgi:hypothetical protein
MMSSIKNYLDPSHQPVQPGQTEEIIVIPYSKLLEQILEEEPEILDDPKLTTFVQNNNELHSSSVSPLKCPTLNDVITVTNVGFQSTFKFYTVFQIIQGLYDHREWAFKKANYNEKSLLLKYHYSDCKAISTLFQSTLVYI